MSIALRGGAPLRALTALLATLAVAPAAASAAPIPVTGQQTAVAPDAGLVQAVVGLGASVKKTGAATVDGQGRFVFPVTGGSLTPELKGRVNHTGGLEFKNKQGVRFGIRTFVIDTRPSVPQLTAEPTLNGFGLGIRVPVATIDGLTVGADAPATVVGGTLKLTDIGALYLNVFLGNVTKRGTVFGQAEARVTLAG